MISWFQRKAILLPVLFCCCGLVALINWCNSCADYDMLRKSISELATLKAQISALEDKRQINNRNYGVNNVHLDNTDDNTLPIIYIITPTYTHITQQADLVRLSNTLKLIQNLHWIVVEDSATKTDLVTSFLYESGLTYTHLNIRTNNDLRRGKEDPRWKKHRGVDQRNRGLKWLREHVHAKHSAVVYFADDDNTYHSRLFAEMRTTRKVSMWPVALVGGLRWEGPVCKGGRVMSFYTSWKPTRKFPVDMAAFALNVKLLLSKPNVYINPDVERGHLETDFLEQLGVDVGDVEAKADDCKKILVWHTQTAEPKLKQEIKLERVGKRSDPEIII